MRSRLFLAGDTTSLVSLVLHHVAGDQWSIGVLGRELAALYNAAVSGREAALPKLPVSYQDYARWQRSGLLEPELERQMAFWRRKLDNLPPADLPTDRPRPRLPGSKGGFCQIAIPPTLMTVLERLGRSTGSTLFMTMLTAFATLLHRITGQEDIPIGVPVANRTQSATEGLVGTFVNTLVLRTDLSGDPTFGQALQRVRATSLEAFANQDIPFDWLVSSLGQRGDPTRAPLVQILFNVVNAPMHGIEFDGTRLGAGGLGPRRRAVRVEFGGRSDRHAKLVGRVQYRPVRPSDDRTADWTIFHDPRGRRNGAGHRPRCAAAAAGRRAAPVARLERHRRALSARSGLRARFRGAGRSNPRRRRGFLRRLHMELCGTECPGECDRAQASRARGRPKCSGGALRSAFSRPAGRFARRPEVGRGLRAARPRLSVATAGVHARRLRRQGADHGGPRERQCGASSRRRNCRSGRARRDALHGEPDWRG